MNLNRSYGNHIMGCSVLNITSNVQDQLPLQVTTMTNGTAAGKFDIIFYRGEKEKLLLTLNLIVALL